MTFLLFKLFNFNFWWLSLRFEVTNFVFSKEVFTDLFSSLLHPSLRITYGIESKQWQLTLPKDEIVLEGIKGWKLNWLVQNYSSEQMEAREWNVAAENSVRRRLLLRGCDFLSLLPRWSTNTRSRGKRESVLQILRQNGKDLEL